MRKTWKERQVSKCIRIGNKYKWLKPLMLLCIILIIALDRSRQGLMKNRKRLIGIGAVFLVFMASNSFSTPAFQSQVVIEVADEQSSEAEIEIELSEVEEEILALEEENAIESSENRYSVDEILQNSSSQAIMNSNTVVTEQKEFSKDDWNLLLVNKQHSVPEDYTFELGTIAANMKCDARILPELFAMLQAAKDDGINLSVCSPYRDISLQNVLFNRKIKLHMGRGDSYMEAYKKASQVVTVPGASEHQIGLAVDIISDTYTVLEEGFGETEAGEWLREHSREYGFILRYPKGKEHITGIDYEPWHFRYVGKEAATIIMEQGITLEEFVESISD